MYQNLHLLNDVCLHKYIYSIYGDWYANLRRMVSNKIDKWYVNKYVHNIVYIWGIRGSNNENEVCRCYKKVL